MKNSQHFTDFLKDLVDTFCKKRKRQVLLERNKEYNGILNRLILAEMNGKFKLTNADYTGLFKSQHTIVDTLGTEMRTLIIKLIENPEWLERIRE